MFEGEHVKQVRMKVKRGVPPKLPARVGEGEGPAAAGGGSRGCEVLGARSKWRPTSIDMRNTLRSALKKITGETGVTRATLPPPPRGRRRAEPGRRGGLLW